LAERVVELLTAARLPAPTDAECDFDHGLFVPCLLIDRRRQSRSCRYRSSARSIPPSISPPAALRDEGILIVRSG
jgi:hypothetical protein